MEPFRPTVVVASERRVKTMAEMTNEDKRKKRISMGPAVLRPMDEQGHFALYRPVLITGWDESVGKIVQVEAGKELGPLMIFRVAAKDEKVDVRTIDPRTQRELLLHKVWDGRQGPGDDLENMVVDSFGEGR